MNTIARFLLVTVCGTLAIGCGRDESPGKAGSIGDPSRPQTQPANNERDAIKYTSAEVKIIYGDLAGRTKRIEDQAGIRRLLSLFPGVGTGKKGPEPPAPWDNAMIIRFTRSDKTVVTVTTSHDLNEGRGIYFWSEGNEDWLIENPDAFRTYIRKLLKEKPKPAKDEKQ